MKCFRVKPFNDQNPLMGDLPFYRVEQNHVFARIGIDYAGPFSIKTHKLRGSKLCKAYIALFVCMVTKAVHLELVTELTTQAFIATFRRFTSRRGKPVTVYSENGSNFVGANRELNDLNNFLKTVDNQNIILKTFSDEGIQWHFLPVASPSFGGMWESGVKLTKHHLRRILGNSHVTFEEFNTILVQIEAILNSRPLSPLSPDPNDIKNI